MFIPREYQVKCHQNVKEAYDRGKQGLLVSMATGTGKTGVGVGIGTFLGVKGKILWLSQTEELIFQTKEEFRYQYPSSRCGIEMGNLFSRGHDDIIIASVQSLGKAGSSRIERFIPEEFSLIVCDEAHHSTPNNTTYSRIFDHFGVSKTDGRRKKDSPLLVGLTATPNRGDNIGLNLVYDELVFSYGIRDAILDGWLTPLECKSIFTDTDLDSVRSNAGDFVNKELEHIVNNFQRNELIFQSWEELASDRQTLAFCVNVAHAEELNRHFRQKGVASAVVHGETVERKDILKAYANKEIRVLFNIKVLTEGYNDPDTSCIIMARPTKSSLLFTQMIGRGTRLQRGLKNFKYAISETIFKRDCLILDVVDNTTKHRDSLMSMPKMFGMPLRTKVNKQNILKLEDEFKETQRSNPSVDFSNLEDIGKIDYYIKDVNLFDVSVPKEIEEASKFMWYKINNDDYVLNLPNKTYITVHKNLLGKFELRAKGSDDLQETANSFQEALNYCEQWASCRLEKHQMGFLKREASWHKDKPTKAQTNYLKLLLHGRLPPDYDKYRKGDVNKLINKLKTEKLKNGRTNIGC